MDDAHRFVSKLMSISTLSPYKAERALKLIGSLIDLSFETQRPEGLLHGLNLAKEYLQRKLRPKQKTTIYYFISNSWGNLRKLKRADNELGWDWDQDELENEQLFLRKAIAEPGFRRLDRYMKCQIFTNLANTLSHIGRFVEAIEYWDRASNLDPSFGMALGNKGYFLGYYSQSLYDEGHRLRYLIHAHRNLDSALQKSLEQGSEGWFKKYRDHIESTVPLHYLTEDIGGNHFSLGSSKKERAYRKWCLSNLLFLNPMNDIEPTSVAAHDIITVPSIVENVVFGPYYYGFYNQMKQEFVSARYLVYDGIKARTIHFSDKDVSLYDTFDSSSYSIADEKIKLGFRSAYSLLDKIAFFVNVYWKLSIPPDRTSFKTIWFVKQNRKNGLKSNFLGKENLFLRGLYWLSKDLYEDKPGFRKYLEPQAKDIAQIRNSLEHKYLKVHGGKRGDSARIYEYTLSGEIDDYIHQLSRDDLIVRTLRILKLVRSAMIYLSLGIHVEERAKRAAEGTEDNSIQTINLNLLNDGNNR